MTILQPKNVDFKTAEQYFPGIVECNSFKFVKYKIEIAMPSNTPVALNYIFTDGTVAICNNAVAMFMPSGKLYEPMTYEGKNYYIKKPDSNENNTVVYFNYAKNFYYVAIMKTSYGDVKSVTDIIDTFVIQ